MEIYSGREKILEAINKLADTVELTMGPEGATVGIADFHGNAKVTKDGVSVANEIEFKDPVENFAAKLLKQAAQNTVREAGDGTTTSIVLAREMIMEGYESELSLRELKSELEKLENIVIEEIFKRAKPVENLHDVALISCNGDKDMADVIVEAYDHSDIVKLEEAIIDKDHVEVINGMRLKGSYFDPAFVNNIKKSAIDYQKCKFIIVKGHLNDINQIKTTLTGTQEMPIIIMADHFHSEPLGILKENHNRGNLAVGLIKTPGMGGHRTNLVGDIIKWTKASKQAENVYLTELDSIFVDKENITFGKEDGSVDYLEDLVESYDENDATHRLLQERIAALSGKMSIITVGGKSEAERSERKDRMEDAVLAVRSAKEEGVIPGGGVPLAEIAKKYEDKNFFAISLEEPHERIKETTENLEITDAIVDPAKVTRCAVQNAISVTKVVLSMGAVVLNPRLWS